MTGRDYVMSRIRRSLGATGDDRDRRATVAARLAAPPPGVIPARGQLEGPERAALFRRMAEKAQATVVELGTAAEIPAAIIAYLRERGVPPAVRMGDDRRLAGVPWSAEPALTVAHGRTLGDDPAGVSHAEAGVAETGSVMLASGPDNPTTLNFLSPTHIVVLARDTIVPDMETAWRTLRDGRSSLPRVANFITGPSRSADIEQTILLGAHGPLRLLILIVG